MLADPATTVAVVGATDNPDKYGGRIYRNLKAKGFKVLAVNPTRDTVDGDAAYATLADLPEEPTIINVVVPPHVGIKIAEEADALGYKRIWYQPGADSAEIVAYLVSHAFDFLAGPCIMVETRPLAAQ